MPESYVELHARSAFSFLEGSSLPEDLIAIAAARQYPAMALLDRDGLYGSPRFHLAAQKAKLKAHIGAEVACERLSPQSHRDAEKTQEEGRRTERKAQNHLQACHPSLSEEPALSLPKGPAFPRPSPPPLAAPPHNLRSEITNLQSLPSMPEPALSAAEGCR